jgi:hypothetical protein
MRVVIGPVSAESAALWLGYARTVVDDLEAVAPGASFANADVQAIFDTYLSEWEAAARREGPFLWSCELPAEQMEYHLHVFHQLATLLAEQAERRGTVLLPDGGREFYAAVLRGALAALESEGPASAAFARHLGEFWPGPALALR